MNTLQIKPVNSENWHTIVSLEVASNQKNFIESNAESLLESFFDTDMHWRCYGLYIEEQAVGFAMIGAYRENEKYIWLDRFMISKNYQQQGLGTRFLQAILSFIQRTWKVTDVVISVDPGNTQAKAFYVKNNFVDTHKIDPQNGEELYCFTYPENA